MSVFKNQARLDLQLYVEIPDVVLEEHGQPGWKRNAIDVVPLLLSGSTTPAEIVSALQPYLLEYRTKVSGGNVQLERDRHLKVVQEP